MACQSGAGLENGLQFHVYPLYSSFQMLRLHYIHITFFHKMILIFLFLLPSNLSNQIIQLKNHVERKVPKYENHKLRKGKWKLLPGIEEMTKGQAHTNTRKLYWNISTGTAVFLNRKRVNVCEHKTKTASLESLRKVPPGGCERDGWREIIWD